MPTKLNIKLDLTGSDHPSDNRPRYIIKQLLQSRGLTDPASIAEFLQPTPPIDISYSAVGINQSQLKKTKQLINQAIAKQSPIIVYGDYDADGITATAVIWETLRSLGAQTLPFIPHRRHHGYGISQPGIDEISRRLIPRLNPQTKSPALILTVDNGIVAHQGIKYAKKLGYQVILCDHHQPGKTLPPADTVIHTTQLAGVGVALFLSRYLAGNKLDQTQFASHLALAALGSVADLVPLTGANRSLVKHGLASLHTTNRVGLKAILAEANINQTELQAYQLGYVIGPRLNALGRLGSATPALRLLCTTDETSAAQLAAQLGQTNRDRQAMTYRAFDLARQLYLADPANSKKKLIFLSSSEFHPGVVGLVAGRLTEEYHLPSIVVAVDGDNAKASARSIEGFDITAALRTHRDLLTEIGGHPLAAGFSVRSDQLSKLADQLQQYATAHLSPDLLNKKLTVDAKLLPTDLTEELVTETEKLVPYGMGSPRPRWLVENLKVASSRQVGSDGKHLKLRFKLPDSGRYLDAIAFFMGDKIGEYSEGTQVNPVFTLELNSWNGRTDIQLKLVA